MSDNLSMFNESRLFRNTDDQRTMKLLDEVNEERRKFLTYKLLTETALVVTDEKDSTMGDGLCTKIKRIAVSLPLDLTTLETPKETLGCDFSRLELTRHEALLLQQNVGKSLIEKYTDLRAKFKEITGVNIDAVSYRTSENKLVVLKQKLNSEQDKYSANLHVLMSAIEDALKVRFQTVPKAIMNKIKEFESRVIMHDLQLTLCAYKMQFCIFHETQRAAFAYKALINDLNEQENECIAEIEVLRKTVEKYDLLSDCPQYKNILKSYLQYKIALERREKMCHKETL